MKFLISQRGVAIYLALIIMFILLGIGLGLSTILIGQIKMMRGIGHSVPAFYAADSGAERALYGVLKDNDKTSKNGTLDNGSSYTVSLCHGKIQSTGSYRNVKRAIETTYPFEGLFVGGYGGGLVGSVFVIEKSSSCEVVEALPAAESQNSFSEFQVYENRLYGGTYNSTGLIFVCDRNSWISPPTDLGEEGIFSFAICDNKLYTGTGSNAILYEYDGIAEQWINRGAPLVSGGLIYALAEYGGNLYVGGALGGARVFIYDPSTNNWDPLPSLDAGSGFVKTLKVYEGNLYAGGSFNTVAKVYIFNGTSWSDPTDLSSGLFPDSQVFDLEVYNGTLYAGSGSNGRIYYNDGFGWQQLLQLAELGNIWSFAVGEGKLFFTASPPFPERIYTYDDGSGLDPDFITLPDNFGYGHALEFYEGLCGGSI